MKTAYADLLIPPHETREDRLTRLSANIDTLTGLMNDAERAGLAALAVMFERARHTKIERAEAVIARMAADGEKPA